MPARPSQRVPNGRRTRGCGGNEPSGSVLDDRHGRIDYLRRSRVSSLEIHVRKCECACVCVCVCVWGGRGRGTTAHRCGECSWCGETKYPPGPTRARPVESAPRPVQNSPAAALSAQSTAKPSWCKREHQSSASTALTHAAWTINWHKRAEEWRRWRSMYWLCIRCASRQKCACTPAAKQGRGWPRARATAGAVAPAGSASRGDRLWIQRSRPARPKLRAAKT